MGTFGGVPGFPQNSVYQVSNHILKKFISFFFKHFRVKNIVFVPSRLGLKSTLWHFFTRMTWYIILPA